MGMLPMFSRSLRFATVAAMLLSAGPAFAGLKVDGKPKVGFHAAGSPGALDIDGTTSNLVMADDGQNLTFTVKLATLTTGIDLRDEHMRNTYGQSSVFPDLIVSIPKASVTFPTEVGADQSGTSTGTFTAHGVSQPVTVNWNVRKSKTGWRVTADFAFNVGNHGISIPSYLGITVDPAMKAAITIDLIDAP